MQRQIEEERSHHQTGVLDLKMQPGFWGADQSFEDDDDEDTIEGQQAMKTASVASSADNNVHDYWQANRYGVEDDDEDDDDDDGNTNDADQPSARASTTSSSEHQFARLNEVDYGLDEDDQDDDGQDLRKESRHGQHQMAAKQPEQIVMEVQQTLEQINDFVQQQQNQKSLSLQGNSIIETGTEAAGDLSVSPHNNLSSTTISSKTNSNHHKTGRRLYKCRHCPFETDKKIENWQHIRIHMRPEKLLCCESCQFVTEYKHHLEYHQRNHTGFKPFKCEHCDYQCVNKSMLNSHMKSHSTIYQFQCGDCKYATKYVHSLKMHLRKYNHQPTQLMIDIYGRKRGPKPGCGGRNSNLNKQTPSSAAPQPSSTSSTGNRSLVVNSRAVHKAAAIGKNQANANQCVLDLRVESKLLH